MSANHDPAWFRSELRLFSSAELALRALRLLRVEWMSGEEPMLDFVSFEMRDRGLADEYERCREQVKCERREWNQQPFKKRDTMSTAIANVQSLPSADILERLIIHGDLSKLSAAEKTQYYLQVCAALDLNPATQPFAYLTLNSKQILYARKECTEQLRKKHDVSVKILARESVEGCYVVTAQAKLPNGREDESVGAVSIEGLKGEARANAMMKAETKSKRRVTLSICGLGMLDEMEVETIPEAHVASSPEESSRPALPAPKSAKRKLPANGQELFERIAARDASLAEEGLCKKGTLLTHVVTQGQKLGFPHAMSDWKGGQIAVASEIVKAWIEEKRSPPTSAQGGQHAEAPADVPPYEAISQDQADELSVWLEETGTDETEFLGWLSGKLNLQPAPACLTEIPAFAHEEASKAIRRKKAKMAQEEAIKETTPA